MKMCEVLLLFLRCGSSVAQVMLMVAAEVLRQRVVFELNTDCPSLVLRSHHPVL